MGWAAEDSSVSCSRASRQRGSEEQRTAAARNDGGGEAASVREGESDCRLGARSGGGGRRRRRRAACETWHRAADNRLERGLRRRDGHGKQLQRASERMNKSAR